MTLNHLFRLILVLALLCTAVQSVQAASFSGEQSGIQRELTSQNSATIISVPSQVANLQDAIQQIPDGGIIELASGNYPAPDGGFAISNLHKGFTIRAVGGTATLDGGGAGIVLRFTNTNQANGGPVLFEGLTFTNGVAAKNGQAGGVTLQNAQATFSNSIFQNNAGNQGAAGGGGISVAVGSTAYFFNCIWTGNTARNYGAGMTIGERSRVYIHASNFTNNRTNLPGHSPVSAGGAIHVGNSLLRVTNTRFEGNQAGYVGGAVYAIGNWAEPASTPQSDIIIANSTFVNNRAARDPGVSFGAPTEGGAFHAEDQTLAKIYNSRFETNSANTGGGVNLYRAVVEIEGSVFKGNQAVGSGGFKGFGGAISAISNDANDATTGSGSINRPPARLSVRHSYIQGRFGSIGLAGQLAGGIYAAGDSNRVYGQNGVGGMGSVAENRAVVSLEDVVLNDLDVQEVPGIGGTGIGAAITTDLADLIIQKSLIMNSDALGTGNSSGGGLAILNQSLVSISDSTLARNTSEKYGGALFIQGSTINVSNSNLIENAIKNSNFGSAIFTSPASDRGLPVNGVIQSSLISNNSGHAVFDDDRTDGPINDVRYNGNTFFHQGGVNAVVYTNSVPSNGWKTVAQLNDLVVQRANGTSTDKSQSPNTALDSAPEAGFLTAVPGDLLQTTAAGDPDPSSEAHLAYAWSGGSVTLDGQTVSGNAGVTVTKSAGTHTLAMRGSSFKAQLNGAAAPAASLSLSGSTLSWSVSGGSLLDAGIDQGVGITPAASGTVQISPVEGRSYRFLAVTKEGGAFALLSAGTPVLAAPDSITLLVGLNLPENRGSIQIANIGGGSMDWSAESKTPDLIRLDTSSGQTFGAASIPFTINTKGLQPGTGRGSIEINAGTGGSRTVLINLNIVPMLKQTFFPTMIR